MRLLLLTLLLFEPIIIDQALYEKIIQGAHQNMRGPENDYLRTLLNALEERAVSAKQAPAPEQK